MFCRCIRAFLLFALCMALLAVPQLLKDGPLFDGGAYYIFYSQSASSNAEITLSNAEDAAKTKRSIRGLTGESTVYAESEKAFSQAEKYGAKLLFCESVCGVVNYYYYSPRLGGAVALAGHAVNLHIAVREDGAAVGTPLIFGGY